MNPDNPNITKQAGLQFVGPSADDKREIWVRQVDLDHHMKYFGTCKRLNAATGKMENYVPSPEEVVADGLEPPEYLEKFKVDSAP